MDKGNKYRKNKIDIKNIYIQEELRDDGRLRNCDLIVVGKNEKKYKAVGIICGGVPVIGWREIDNNQ